MSAKPLEAFALQVQYCEANSTPVTAAICRALGEALDESSAVGRRVLGWSGHATRDALPLRLVGGIHHAWRKGNAPELAGLFGGQGGDKAAMQAFLRRADTDLLPWLDGPPQTNEPGRSAQLMMGLPRNRVIGRPQSVDRPVSHRSGWRDGWARGFDRPA